MRPLRGLFAGQSAPVSAERLEIAVNDVVKQAEELCWLLRNHRESLAVDALSRPINAKE